MDSLDEKITKQCVYYYGEDLDIIKRLKEELIRKYNIPLVYLSEECELDKNFFYIYEEKRIKDFMKDRSIDNIFLVEERLFLKTEHILKKIKLFYQLQEKSEVDKVIEKIKSMFHLDFPENGIDLNELIVKVEEFIIKEAMGKTLGNKKKASLLLKIKRTTLIEKIKKMSNF